MKTKIISVILLFSMGFMACKKESTTATPKTTQEKLFGKWNMISTYSNDFHAGTNHYDTTMWLPGDYIEFRNDGKAYAYNSSSYDTAAYAILNDTKIWIDTVTNTYDIKILTEDDLKLYTKYVYSQDYSEAAVVLKR